MARCGGFSEDSRSGHRRDRCRVRDGARHSARRQPGGCADAADGLRRRAPEDDRGRAHRRSSLPSRRRHQSARDRGDLRSGRARVRPDRQPRHVRRNHHHPASARDHRRGVGPRLRGQREGHVLHGAGRPQADAAARTGPNRHDRLRQLQARRRPDLQHSVCLEQGRGRHHDERLRPRGGRYRDPRQLRQPRALRYADARAAYAGAARHGGRPHSHGSLRQAGRDRERRPVPALGCRQLRARRELQCRRRRADGIVALRQEESRMKLGLSIGYSGAELKLPVEKVLLAERLGFDSVWTAEAYGSDAITPLAYLAALTKRIRLGTGIMQLAARTPAAAAMAAGTVDALAGSGRVIAGLGVSGPQIVEGWYGQPWGKPYWRIRDYVAIMRKVFERKDPVSHAGREISLPYTGPGALGVGKPLTSILHMNPRLPIWLGTGTEANVKLTAEIADGWLPLGFVPRLMPMLRPWLEEGFRRAGGGKGFASFEIQPRAEVAITDDVRGALARMKPRVALYVGGMGPRDKNFHKAMMLRRGFGDVAQKIQELFLAKRKDEAVAAVPDEFCDEMSLVGPVGRIRERYSAWADSGITGLTISTEQTEAMELMASLAGAAR